MTHSYSRLTVRTVLFSSALAFGLTGCAKLIPTHDPNATPVPDGQTPGQTKPGTPKEPTQEKIRGTPPALAPHERLITILGTNDIHGAAEAADELTGKAGGMAYWASVVDAIRSGLARKYGRLAGTLLVDAGDQFQGTLLSNFDEGQLIFKLMNLMSYDAAVPGNHAYDFGPIDLRRDRVSVAPEATADFNDLPGIQALLPQGPPDMNPRGALERLTAIRNPQGRKMALVSANTYFKASLRDEKGAPIPVNPVGCVPRKGGAKIDWSAAQRPDFLVPSSIHEVAGVRVAVIGLDHAATSTTTTADNVTDLCFRDLYESYLEERAALLALDEDERPQVFVMLIHDGVTDNDGHVMRLVEKLSAHPGGRAVDAVVAGHTHYGNLRYTKEQAVLIQSRSDGRYFGRVDLVWDTKSGALVNSKMWAAHSIRLSHGACDSNARHTCRVETATDGSKHVLFENVEARASDPNSPAALLIAEAKAKVRQISELNLGQTTTPVKRAREVENALSNRVTDALRQVTGADIAIINGGGLRIDLAKGKITYENLYRMIPFNNQLVKLAPVRVEQLVALYTLAAQSCGARGSLFQSGISVKYSRNCRNAVEGRDPSATVDQITTFGGSVVYDRENPKTANPRTFTVATVDFLADGGSEYLPFREIPRPKPPEAYVLGVMREQLRREFAKNPVNWDDKLDGRFQNQIKGGDPGSPSLLPGGAPVPLFQPVDPCGSYEAFDPQI